MALLDPTVTITPLSVQYYKKEDETDDSSNPLLEWMYGEFIFIKLDINNKTKKNIEFEDCQVEILSTYHAFVKFEVLPVNQGASATLYLGRKHPLQHDLPFPITMNNLVEMPMKLNRDENFYKYLCLKIIDWPHTLRDVCLKIEIMEGRDVQIGRYKTIFKIDMQEEFISIARCSRFWKNINYDENGIIKGLR